MNINPRQGVVLRHSRLSHLELANLLKERVLDGQKAWYLVAGITDTGFGDFDKAAVATLVTDQPQGRIFCAACEIRWKRALDVDHSDVLVLCEDPTLKLAGFQPIGEGWQVVAPGRQVMLMAWGSPPDPSAPYIRMETRLPKHLRYPIECQEGRLSCLYYYTPSGEVQFLRLVGVK